MKKFFLSLAVCFGIAMAFPQHSQADSPTKTILPSGNDRYEWKYEDGGRLIINATPAGEVIQCIRIDKEGNIIFMWP